MCWNASVSLFTFLSSTLMSGYLFQRNGHINDRPLSIFIFWVALMQLFEFFMWKNMTDHTLASKLAYITTILQPFVLAASLTYFYGTTDPMYLFVMLLSVIQACAATYYAFGLETKSTWLSEKGPNGHLIWWYKKYEEKIPFIAQVDTLYFLTLMAAVLLIKTKQSFVYLFVMLTSFFLTSKFYGEECGSLWCWVVNLIAMLSIFMPYVKGLN